MNTGNIKKIKVMQNSLMLLRIPFLFPTTKEMNDPKTNIYIKFLLVNLSSMYYPIGAVMHMTFNARKGIVDTIDKDIGAIISYFGCTYFLFRYLLNLKKVIRLYKEYSDFESFGQPKNFTKRNQYYNKLSKIYISYHTCVITTMISATFLYVPECERENMEKGLNEVCGLPAPTWLPFEFDYFPVKQLVYLYQGYSIFSVYQSAGFISFCMMETLEHLVLRFEHVGDTFVEAFSESDRTIRRQKFFNAVRYHQAVIGMGTLLNECFSPCMMVHISLTGPFLGVCGYTFLTRIPLDSSALLVGWIVSTYIVCLGGQRLMEASMSVGTIMERINWYDVETSLQKDLILVMSRSRKPMYLRAGPFGPITYATIVMILKTSYSYVTLLKQTM